MLVLIAIGAAFRLFTKDQPAEGDNLTLTQYVGLIVLLSMLVLMSAQSVPVRY
jgi:hypothetical protein